MGYQNDKPSMFDDMAPHITAAVQSEIAEQLFDSWIGGHLDEGMFYADYQMALMTDDISVKKRFNEYWEVTPDDDEYLEVG